MSITATDCERLGSQFERVFSLMSDGRWRTLAEITVSVGNATEPAVSARLRDMRKKQFGSHTVARRRVIGSPGPWEYQVQT